MQPLKNNAKTKLGRSRCNAADNISPATISPTACSPATMPRNRHFFIHISQTHLFDMAYLFTSESVSEGHPDKVAD
ncbi:MAG: hypothetical protein ACI4T7_07080, partial [Alloprevotella sp.]